MAALDVASMIKRVNAARATKELWKDELRQCYRYTIPHKQTFDEFSRGQNKHEYVFDSTAVVGVEKYASRMQSQLVPPWKNWAKLEAGTDIPEDEKEKVDQYLEQATKVIFDHLNHSNFSTQIHEAFLDLSISTGAIICEEGDGIKTSLNFRSVSLSEILIEQTTRGLVENVWRDLKVPARDIQHVWKKAKLNADLQKIVNDSPEKEIPLVEGVVYDDETRMYRSFLMSEAHQFVMFEEMLETSPWIVFRESVIAGETLGRGRVMTLLYDIKTLNKIVEFNLENAAMASSGIYTATDDGVINPYNIRIRPRAIIPVGSNDNANPTLRPLPQAGNFDLTQVSINDLRDNIREYLYSQPFGGAESQPQRTALEMGIRNDDFMQTTSSAYTRLQTELLDRLLTRIVDILKKAGKIAPMSVDGKEVTIKFTSPIARKQDVEELESTSTFAQYMQIMPPEVAQEEINYGNIVKNLVKTTGVPKDYQYSDEEKEERAAQQAQAREEAMALAQQEAQQEGGES